MRNVTGSILLLARMMRHPPSSAGRPFTSLSWCLAAALLAAVGGCTGTKEADTDRLIADLQEEADQGRLHAQCNAAAGWRYNGYQLANHVVVSGSDGRLISQNGSSRGLIDGLIGNVVAWSRTKPGKPARILFYFNGGLNSRETVLEQAARQVPCILGDGFYPVFMIWDTQAFRSYGEQAFWLRNGQLQQDRQLTTGAVYVLGDVVEGIGRAPSDYIVHAKRYWNTLLTLHPCSDLLLPSASGDSRCPAAQNVSFVGRGEEVSADKNVLVDFTLVDQAAPTSLGGEIGYGALWPVRLVTTPFADGLGASGWSNFVRRTRTTIRKPIEFDLDREINDATPCPRNLIEDMQMYAQGTGAFSKLFQQLQWADQGKAFPTGRFKCGSSGDEIETEPPTQPAEIEAFAKLDLAITMVGHSMGAIVINELVERYRDLPYTDVIYMASAASIRDSRRAIEPLLLQHQNLRFFNLMLHPKNDAGERDYYGSIPSGSLLTWIDEMYEPAKTPEDRAFGYWPNAKAARPIFNKDASARMLYRVFNLASGGNRQCKTGPCRPANPVGHGDFNNDIMCFWRPAYWGATVTAWSRDYGDLPLEAQEECKVQ